MAESDEVGEELDRVLRVTLTAAGQLGEAAARRNADRQREAASVSREAAAAAARELTAQRHGARLVSRQAGDSRFWDSATPRDVGQVWQAARTWSEQDPQAAAAAGLVRSGVQRKWGIDVDALTAAAGTGRSPRDQAQDLVNALSDQAAARDERLDAALDRTLAGGLERIGQAQDASAGPGAGADERDLAGRLRETADVHDLRAADLDRVADLRRSGEREPAGVATRTPPSSTGQSSTGQSNTGHSSTGPAYARARASELRDVPAAAAAARLDAAAGFPMPAHEAIASKTGTKARVARHPGSGASRDHDRSR